MKERYEKLVQIINEASYNYYVLDSPKLTDQEYDDYYHELEQIEKNHPELIRDDSPTKKIGGKVIDKFNKIEHEIPMMSLGDIFNEEEIIKFDERIRKTVPNISYICELKIDGLSVSLLYNEGKLVRAATRGDGIIGEDITHNVVTIKNVPLLIDYKGKLEVRGEIYMPKKSFENINEERIKAGETPFSNPRNAAAGSVRQLDSKIAAKRNLSTFIYHMPNAKQYNINSQYEALEFMKQNGFTVNPNIINANNIDEVIKYIEKWTKKRSELAYEIDGIVIKVNNLDDQEKLGYTLRTPKWAIAYKFPAAEVLTKIEGIEFCVGRTGKVTPRADLSPVHLAGSVIRSVTLHNEEYIKSKDIMINDIVSIHKAGDVIPEVVEVKKERRTGDEIPFKMIDVCPICSTKLILKDSLYYCPNNLCDARKIEGLIHFSSRDTMNIEGFGESIVEDFYNMGYLKKIDDYYHLYEHKEELKELEGFGEKSIDNLLDSIEKSKKNSLEKLLFALGIRHVGKRGAKILASKYHNIDNIMNATLEELSSIDNIGDIIAKSVYEYFRREETVELIDSLKSVNVNMTYLNESKKENEKFKEKTFVLTGTLEKIKREKACEIIENLGGKTTSSVTKKTSVVIVGDSPGSKYEKAKKLNIEIWDEEKFINMIGGSYE